MAHEFRPRPSIAAVLSAAAMAAFSHANAAPNVSRLTPPSNPIVAGAATLARFLPGQRFDLQATAQPGLAGNAIVGVEFKVDGVTVANVTAAGPNPASASVVTSGLVSGLAAGTAVVSLRAYSNPTPGVHALTATATESDGTTTTRTGNFEVIGITSQGRLAKNIIIMLGDGMGASHRTAGRIMAKGYLQGKAQGRLAMDTFPFTGMVMTSSLDSIVTDSAPGMSNYVNGNKANNNQEGVFPDDTTAAFDNPRIEYLSEFLARTKGTSLGIVTTSDVFDATPAANAVHTSARGNGTGIVDQYLDDRGLTNLTVLLGGGRKWFLPNPSNSTTPQPVNGSQRRNSSDYVLPADIVSGWGAAPGALDSGRDLITDFQTAGFTYVPDNATLQANAPAANKLLGLFSFSNMNVSFDKINGRRGTSTVVNDYGFPDQPMLDEMVGSALTVLAKNPNGFILMAEGASIDKQSHLMDADRWILEVLEFDRAVKRAQDFAAANPDTLVIVTADHECAGASIIGASLLTNANLQAQLSGAHTAATQRDNVVGLYEAAHFPTYAIQADGYPTTTDIDFKMLIGYGASADRYETWLSSALPAQDSQQPFVGQAPLNAYPTVTNRNATTGFFITGQISQTSSGGQAAHTGTDIPLSAYGRGSSLFTGLMDNTDVFFKLGQAAIGGAR